MINLHAHLELSQLSAPLAPPVGMADWVGDLLRFRRSPAYNAQKGIKQGLNRQELLESTTVLADIVPIHCPEYTQHYTHLHPHGSIAVFPFVELIAWRPEQVAAVFAALPKCYGLSPHAPQTVCPELLNRAVKTGKPLAMHIAETPEELQLLRDHSGPLLDLMRHADADYDPKQVLLGQRPLDYLQLLAASPLALIIHGNCLDEEEMRFLARHRETMIVVYCPRSHAYFCRTSYPLRQMLDLGVCVALGTDSAASTPDLNIAEEVRFAVSQHASVPPETIRQLASPERILDLFSRFAFTCDSMF